MLPYNRGDNLYQVKDAKKKTVYDYTMEYLEAKYDITYNEISHDFQISFKGSKEWQYLNLNSLIIELAKAGIDIPNGKLEILIRSEWIPKYNPIREYFEDLAKWDGEDHIMKLTSYVPTYEKEAFNYHFKKWLVRTIKCALEHNYFNKQAFKITNGYSHIDLYLDNDANGKRTAKRFMENSGKCCDRSTLYKGLKDMNEWLIESRKRAGGQGMQDVSLLPQRPSCIAPDGRKLEGK